MSFPIYALWCHPRSRSTAVERAMIERGDLTVVHEPLSVVYYQNRRPEVPHLERDGAPRSYEEARELLLERAQHGPVLFKEMAYHGGQRLLDDTPLLERMTHGFLVRDPALSIASHFAIDPAIEIEEVGLEALWHLFERVQKLLGTEPPVLDTEAMAKAPDLHLDLFCRRLGLEPRPEAVNWKPGERREWRSWGEWHSEAAASSGIHARTTEYAATVENTPRLRQLDAHHRPYYERLLEVAHQLSPETAGTHD